MSNAQIIEAGDQIDGTYMGSDFEAEVVSITSDASDHPAERNSVRITLRLGKFEGDRYLVGELIILDADRVGTRYAVADRRYTGLTLNCVRDL